MRNTITKTKVINSQGILRGSDRPLRRANAVEYAILLTCSFGIGSYYNK